MLTITRRTGETIHIFPGDDIDPNMTVAELFGEQEIVIRIGPVSGSRTRLSITAPRCLKIWRGDGQTEVAEPGDANAEEGGPLPEQGRRQA